MDKFIDKVILLVGGFPTLENPARCIFNYRAAQHISERGINLQVLFIRAWIPGRPLLSSVNENGFKVTTLYIPMIPGYSVLSLKTYIKLYPYFLRRLVSDASIIHSVGADTIGVFGSMIAKKFKLKHVTQLIGSDVNSILPITNNNWGVKGWENHIHGISANNTAILHNFRTLYPNLNAKAIVNYRGVNLEVFNPSFNFKNQLYFLFLGGLPDYPNLPYGSNTKGGESLMRIWKEIEKCFNNDHLPRLIFGGPGSDKKEVFDWRETLKYKHNVDILGNIKPSQVREYMQMASLVIIPSKEEGVPNIGFESLAMGLPILGSNVGGIPELVKNNVNGWILEPNDESAWVVKIKEIIQNSSTLHEMGMKSRQIAEQRFSHILFGDRIERLYKEILET